MPGSVFYDPAPVPAAPQPQGRGRVNDAIILDEILDLGETNYIDPSGPAALKTPGPAATEGKQDLASRSLFYQTVVTYNRRHK